MYYSMVSSKEGNGTKTYMKSATWSEKEAFTIFYHIFLSINMLDIRLLGVAWY